MCPNEPHSLDPAQAQRRPSRGTRVLQDTPLGVTSHGQKQAPGVAATYTDTWLTVTQGTHSNK